MVGVDLFLLADVCIEGSEWYLPSTAIVLNYDALLTQQADGYRRWDRSSGGDILE